MKIVIDGRSTGRGAYTSAGGRRFNTSKTGHHWSEELFVSEGETFPVVDVSNSGKHSCWIGRVQAGQVVTEYRHDPWSDEPCQVCDAMRQRMAEAEEGLCRTN